MSDATHDHLPPRGPTDETQVAGRDAQCPVAALIREAVDAWLSTQKVRSISEDEWNRRFDSLMARRTAIWKEHSWDPDEVERDVSEAVREVRAERARRRPDVRSIGLGGDAELTGRESEKWLQRAYTRR
jgi:hypothetical protein